MKKTTTAIILTSAVGVLAWGLFSENSQNSVETKETYLDPSATSGSEAIQHLQSLAAKDPSIGVAVKNTMHTGSPAPTPE